MAQWPAENLAIPSGCSEDNPTFTLTELYRTGYGDGIGEPTQGFGITPKGAHVVREGANFSILYRLKACMNLDKTALFPNANTQFPNAQVILDPDGNAKGWTLGATFTGFRPQIVDTGSNETVSRFGKWIQRSHGARKVIVYVLDIWVHGTTTDDNCTGIPTGSSATAGVDIYLLDGANAKTTANTVYTLRKMEDDDAKRGALYGVFPCT